MTFTFLDFIFSTVIFVFAIVGAINGFIKEVFSKIAVVLSIFLGVTFSSELSPVFQSVVANKTVDLILAFLTIFIISFLVIKIVQSILEKVFSFPILSSLDRVLGLAFGLLQGLFIIAIFLILALSQPWFDFSDVGSNSFYYNILKVIIDSPIQKIKEFIA